MYTYKLKVVIAPKKDPDVGLNAENLVQDFRLLLAISTEPFRTMVIVTVCVGLRLGELLQLRWRDLAPDFLDLTVRRKAVSEPISLPLCPELGEILRVWRSKCPTNGDGDWIFPRPRATDKPYPSALVILSIRKQIKVANLNWPSSWHAFRFVHRIVKRNAAENLSKLASGQGYEENDREFIIEVQGQILRTVSDTGSATLFGAT